MAEGTQQNRPQQNPQQQYSSAGGNERSPQETFRDRGQQSGESHGQQGAQNFQGAQRGGYAGNRQQGAQYGQHGQQGGRYGSQGAGQQQQQFNNGGQFQNIAEVALRGTALLFDLQLEAARNAWETQARGVAMLGAPDFSNLFRIGDDRARRIFTATTEQLVNTIRRTADTVIAVQQEIGKLAEQQTVGMTDQMRQQIEHFGQQTQRGLDEIQQMSVDQLNQANQATRDMYDEADYAQRQQRGQASERDAQFARGNGGQQESGVRPQGEQGEGTGEHRIITPPGAEARPNASENERGRGKRT
jgi:phasin protein